MSLCFPPWESHFQRLEERLWANLGALTQLLWDREGLKLPKYNKHALCSGLCGFGTFLHMYKSKLEIWWNSPCETQSSGLKLAKLIQPRWLYNTLLLSIKLSRSQLLFRDRLTASTLGVEYRAQLKNVENRSRWFNIYIYWYIRNRAAGFINQRDPKAQDFGHTGHGHAVKTRLSRLPLSASLEFFVSGPVYSVLPTPLSTQCLRGHSGSLRGSSLWRCAYAGPTPV